MIAGIVAFALVNSGDIPVEAVNDIAHLFGIESSIGYGGGGGY